MAKHDSGHFFTQTGSPLQRSQIPPAFFVLAFIRMTADLSFAQASMQAPQPMHFFSFNITAPVIVSRESADASGGQTFTQGASEQLVQTETTAMDGSKRCTWIRLHSRSKVLSCVSTHSASHTPQPVQR